VVTFRYRPEVLEQLLLHGVRPTTTTSPEIVYDFVSDLYRYELRRLRDEHRAGRISKPDYIPHVLELRKKYWMLSVRLDKWKDG